MSWIRESKNAYKMDSITMKMSESRISEHPQHRPGRDRIAVATATGLCGCAHWLAEPILRVEFLCWPCAKWCSVARGKRYSRMIASMRKISGRRGGNGRNEQPGKKGTWCGRTWHHRQPTLSHLSPRRPWRPSSRRTHSPHRREQSAGPAPPGCQSSCSIQVIRSGSRHPRRLLELFSRLAS